MTTATPLPPVPPAPAVPFASSTTSGTAPSHPQSPDRLPQTLDPKPQTPRVGEAVALRLVSWPADHEVRHSRRTWERLDSVRLPTHHDSLGFRLLSTQPDAPALLAAWTLLVQISARLPRPLRGLLVTATGYAYTVEDLALMTGFPAAFFTRAFAFFSSESVGWLALADDAAVPLALREIADYRAAEAALQAQRSAQAAHRRRERRAARVTSSQLDPFIAALTAPDPDTLDAAPSPATASRLAETSASADALHPAPARRPVIPDAALATEPTPHWRTLLLTGLGSEVTPEDEAFWAQAAWSDCSPALQRELHQLYVESQDPGSAFYLPDAPWAKTSSASPTHQSAA